MGKLVYFNFSKKAVLLISRLQIELKHLFIDIRGYYLKTFMLNLVSVVHIIAEISAFIQTDGHRKWSYRFA